MQQKVGYTHNHQHKPHVPKNIHNLKVIPETEKDIHNILQDMELEKPIGAEVLEKEFGNGANLSFAEHERLLKQHLFEETLDKEIKTKEQNLPIENKEETINTTNKRNINQRIKDWKESIEQSFVEGLDDMLKADIITPEEKKEVMESLKSPEVVESIKTWISVFGFSTLYIGVNTVTITPLASLIGSPAAGAIAYLAMYILKRFMVSGIINIVGKNLKRKKYIANMSMIPILGEQITLIELYKNHPLAAQLFYAFMKTKKTKKKYMTCEDDTQDKENLRLKWKNKVEKNKKWLKNTSDVLADFETNIGNFFINMGSNVNKLFH